MSSRSARPQRKLSARAVSTMRPRAARAAASIRRTAASKSWIGHADRRSRPRSRGRRGRPQRTPRRSRRNLPAPAESVGQVAVHRQLGDGAEPGRVRDAFASAEPHRNIRQAARRAIGEGGTADRREAGVAHHDRGGAVPDVRHDESRRPLVQSAEAFVGGSGHPDILSSRDVLAVARRASIRKSDAVTPEGSN